MTITASGPSAWIASASCSGLAPSAEPGELPRLGQVGRHHGGSRQDALDQGRLRVRVEQHGAALGDHHRVDDDRRVPDEVERLDHRVDRRLVAEHADLDPVDADVVGDRADLGDDHLAAAPG